MKYDRDNVPVFASAFLNGFKTMANEGFQAEHIEVPMDAGNKLHGIQSRANLACGKRPDLENDRPKPNLVVTGQNPEGESMVLAFYGLEHTGEGDFWYDEAALIVNGVTVGTWSGDGCCAHDGK